MIHICLALNNIFVACWLAGAPQAAPLPRGPESGSGWSAGDASVCTAQAMHAGARANAATDCKRHAVFLQTPSCDRTAAEQGGGLWQSGSLPSQGSDGLALPDSPDMSSPSERIGLSPSALRRSFLPLEPPQGSEASPGGRAPAAGWSGPRRARPELRPPACASGYPAPCTACRL